MVLFSPFSARADHTGAVSQYRAGAVAPRYSRHPRVEANARLTATTGVLLLVMLAAEGVTVAAIGPLLPWHIGIGLALIPPVLVKMGSTLWRFVHFYLGDPRYRNAGPPAPLLRAVGPLVMLSTVALLLTGIAAWLAGPPAPLFMELHKATFVIWFGVMTIHVLGHTSRATRLVRKDWVSRWRRSAAGSPRARRTLVFASLIAGLILGISTRGMLSGWAVWTHAR